VAAGRSSAAPAIARASRTIALPGEFRERLRWFGRLRWLATGGLVFVSLVGSRIDAPHLWPSLFLVACFVGAYNLCFHLILRRGRRRYSDVRLRALGIAEIALDLAALLVVVHFTGGLMSPALVFFVFHMAIGTTLLSNATMYRIAAATCGGLAGLHLLEGSGLLSRQAIGVGDAACGRLCDLNLLAVLVAVLGTVYLTGTVTRASRRKGVELRQATMELGARGLRLERALEEIRDLERRKSHYMRISAHQLRSPLGTIKTVLQVLTQGFVDPASKRGREVLAGAVERTDHLLAIANDLLELAKIREGQERAPWARNLDLGRLLTETLDELEPAARSRRICLQRRLQGEVTLNWGVVPDLRFAFENLIDNAIRYSRPGGEVEVSVAACGERATICVVDQGIGVPVALQPDVFLEFVRGPEARRLAPNGTGLGLTIVKAAIELHGGTVSLTSQPGLGTTVTISLPLSNTPPPAVAALQDGPGL
jgi:signal transduction histidine kinase